MPEKAHFTMLKNLTTKLMLEMDGIARADSKTRVTDVLCVLTLFATACILITVDPSRYDDFLEDWVKEIKDGLEDASKRRAALEKMATRQ